MPLQAPQVHFATRRREQKDARFCGCRAPPHPMPSLYAPEGAGLAPPHSAQVVQGVDVGKPAGHGHAKPQVALPKAQRVVQDEQIGVVVTNLQTKREERGC